MRSKIVNRTPRKRSYVCRCFTPSRDILRETDVNRRSVQLYRLYVQRFVATLSSSWSFRVRISIHRVGTYFWQFSWSKVILKIHAIFLSLSVTHYQYEIVILRMCEFFIVRGSYVTYWILGCVGTGSLIIFLRELN